MASFSTDLQQEHLLAQYLDRLYAQKNIQVQRITDMEQQMRGIDIIITIDGREYLMDEKAQLHYLNSDLPTFTFELSYLLGGESRVGWLLDADKVTEYYFLITAIFLQEGKEKIQHPEDIQRLKITSVHRQRLIGHLGSIGLDRDRLTSYEREIRAGQDFGKIAIPELHPQREGALYYTEHLDERPINLQLRLHYLIAQGVARTFHPS